MDRNPYAPDFEFLPETLAVFPLTGVLLLPGGQLPLNIFEPRYLDLINDAMAGNRMIGMIQPKQKEGDRPEIYDTGCCGKITEFAETEDGRYLINLTGICRFKVSEELKATTKYRQVKPDWSSFEKDLTSLKCLDLDREKLTKLLKIYFSEQGLSCDWEKVDDAPDGKLITCLSMICPFSAREKQALLEAECCQTRAQTFMTMLELAVHDKKAACEKAKH